MKDSSNNIGRPGGALYSRRSYVWLMMSVLLAASVSFIGIGNNDYWDDEANTAIIGRNFMNTGSLTAWDGRNLMSYGMKGAVDENMTKKGPPLQYIIAGISLKLFGNTTTGGRLLFWIIGLLTIPMTALWYREEFGYRHCWVVGLILALTVPYLLYIRQVRYYAPGLFLSFGVLWVWASIKSTERIRPWIIAGLALLALLISCQYLFAAATMAIIGLSFLRKAYRNKNNAVFFGLILLLGLAASACILVYSPKLLQRVFSLQAYSGNRLAKVIHLLRITPGDTLYFEFVPVGMLVFLIPGLFFMKQKRLPYLQDVGILLIYGFGIIATTSLFHPMFNTETLPFQNLGMRYYIMLIPLGAAMAGILFEMLWFGRHRGLGPVFLVILLSSNLLTFNFLGEIGLHSRLYEYVRENLADYTTGSEAISRYIEDHIGKDECILMVPLYYNIIQMFYHPEHKFCGVASAKAGFAVKHAGTLREDLFFENVIPSYFILGGWSAKDFKVLLDQLYGEGAYRLIEVLPVFWRNVTRPEIPWRRFGPVHISDPQKDGVSIFKRTEMPAHLPQFSASVFERYIGF